MWKPTKTIQDCQSLGPDVKTGPPECEATELTTQLRRQAFLTSQGSREHSGNETDYGVYPALAT
jgi:hypothetical protein